MAKTEPTTYLHFYATRYTPEGAGETAEPKLAYSWYLEKSDGSQMTMSDRRWLTKAGVIKNATEVLGDRFWEDTHTVIQEDWLGLLTGETSQDELDKKILARLEEEEQEAKRESIFSDQGTTQSDFSVELVDSMGSDQSVCQAARVSTVGADSYGTEESQGLINFLMKNRHGSPFEHGTLTFRITAPIFVWREFMRHRIGFSYNEQSGRYMELDAVSYLPTRDRPLIQVGKAGHYTFVAGTDEDFEFVIEQLCTAYDAAWSAYHAMLDRGIAKEVARFPLPVAAYSTAYVTCNPRSLMSFLSLRTHREDSKFPSYPQWEIAQVAEQMEAIFGKLFPMTLDSFTANGRVSP
ncbi:thymidylate synthase [Gordonia phage Secretariat]|uniref:ThyX-like thymidylate synthase n=1 Tax=Gordonia phage Secretariat TaxID=2725616 RepID=A0A6M3SUN2_9CAUD|nr:thymidylate synthase [Gordonia phage Secretariat]QJD49645.1 ThyX-like thymidylate synthase [Gordonia phage Secretariat]